MAKKNVLFIVPESKLDRDAHLIGTVLWAIESQITYDVFSAGAFVDKYGALSAADAVQAMREDYGGICNLGMLTKREEKLYRDVMNPCMEYAKAHPATDDPAVGNGDTPRPGA